ncbi:MAG: CxxxxCH/CxxCH domain-containing protein [Deltaproteobacteria bacterium]|nr:CxxxxCH/CxxCH domain-containing protein [Deltaproteobacteria bacterium]
MRHFMIVMTLAALLGACSDSSTPIIDGGVLDKAVNRLEAGQRPDSYLGDFGLTEPGCNVCHGDKTNPAPPRSLGGETATNNKAVGAHQAHLGSSDWRAPMRCDDCHQVPKSYVDPGHLDTALPAELTFSPLSKTDGAAPTWDGTSCSGTYCHGATLKGGRHTSPIWTLVDGSQVACSSCHGFPPAEPHPQSYTCADCHGAVVNSENTIITPNLHIDGKLQLENIHAEGYASGSLHGKDFNQKPEGCGSASCHGDELAGAAGPSCSTCHPGWQTSCSFCHGGADNTTGAPPKSVANATAVSVRGVGAHSAHLKTSTWRAPVNCTDCHRVPNALFDTGHLGPAPAELSFSALSRSDNATPSFDGTTCSGTYCHGATMTGGQHSAPTWTTVDGTQTTCTGCHGMPPAGTHPTSSACSVCHAAVVNASNRIIAANLHIDGTVQLSQIHPKGYAAGDQHGPDFNSAPQSCKTASCHGDTLLGGAGPSCQSCHANWQTNCTFCHGGTDNTTGAPPESVAGGTATTLRNVGAHSAHLKSTSSWYKTFVCTDCHVKPATLEASGHLGPAPAELSFSNFVRSDGANPQWTGTTCSGTYCHGATMDGGQHSAPTWTTVDGTQVTCTGCHGMPPGGSHPASSACSVCHSEVVNASNQIIGANLHIDGIVQASANHPAGYGNNDVHGKDFEASPESCKGAACHGDTYLGGAGTSCESCHPGWRKDCTFCHGGTDNTTGAPPLDLGDNTASTSAGVGAHSRHVMTTNHEAYACTTCHPDYQDALDAGHLADNAGDVTFGGIAAGATYDANANTCNNVYCHGNGRGDNGSATWTGSLTGGCSACHDDRSDGDGMTLSGAHDEHVIGEGYSCALCHSCVTTGDTITTPTAHVNGTVEICAMTRINWDLQNKRCSPPFGPCHNTLDWY